MFKFKSVNQIYLLALLVIFLLCGCSSKQGPCLVCKPNQQAVNKSDEVSWQSLNTELVKFYSAKRIKESEEIAQKALDFAKRKFGPNDARTATSINNLAELYRVQGNYKKAEVLYKQSLDIRKKILGKDHPDVSLSLNNLGAVYVSLKKFHEAEECFKQAIKIIEDKLGKTNPALHAPVGNLADLYTIEGKLTEAQINFKKLVLIYENANKKEDNGYIKALNSLAAINFYKGDYKEAKNLFTQTLHLAEKKFGETSPELTTILENLTEVSKKLKDEPLTKAYLQRLNTIRKVNNLPS